MSRLQSTSVDLVIRIQLIAVGGIKGRSTTVSRNNKLSDAFITQRRIAGIRDSAVPEKTESILMNRIIPPLCQRISVTSFGDSLLKVPAGTEKGFGDQCVILKRRIAPDIFIRRPAQIDSQSCNTAVVRLLLEAAETVFIPAFVIVAVHIDRQGDLF